MRVSVVVPVYNPGGYIADLIASLRAQTLDPSEFEVLFVDDGSTDATPALLDEVAAETPGFRAIRTPKSGWPGRPRNIGLDSAVGDYVFLSDHDDRLDPRALERLADFADRRGSDVVIGKVVGVNRNAPDRIFARTLVDAQEDPGLIMSSLTPQKLYRRAFLNERGIRFPEGKRRLEDHLFVTTAYLRARRVSVYADDPVYSFVLRDDGRNASRSAIEWRGSFANAAESIAVVDAEAPDEATRVTMRARWMRPEAMNRLRGRRLLDQPDQDALLDAATDLLRQHYPVAEVDRLGAADRLIGRLLLDGRPGDVIAFAGWEADLGVTLTLLDAQTGPDAVVARVRAEVRAPDRSPAFLAALPDGYPSRDAVLRTARFGPRAIMTARYRRTDGVTLETRIEQVVEDGVLTATVTLPPRRLADDRGGPVAPPRDGPRPGPPGLGRAEGAGGGDRVERTIVRIGDRRFGLSVGAQRRLVLRVDRAGLVPTARRTAARVLRRVRRVRGGVGRRVRRLLRR